MKKWFSLLIVALFATNMLAEDVSRDEALRIAERFFAQQLSSAETSSAKTNAQCAVKNEPMRVAYISLQEGDKTTLYVINRGENSGFVIVSADEDTNHPVLGWSDHGAFDYDKAPIQLKDMLEAYSQACLKRTTDTASSIPGLVTMADGRLASVVTDGRRQSMKAVIPLPVQQTTKRRVESVPNVVVQPLVKVNWDQVGEYAQYVDPYYESAAGVAAGCVPAAMAQIMKFWEYPARGRGFHLHNILDAPDNIDFAQLVISGQDAELNRLLDQYSHPYIVNFGASVYNWKDMGGNHPSTDAECDNVAKLIFDCHVACAPTKLPNGRGTSSSLGSAIRAMKCYFGYSPDMEYIPCEGHEDQMRQELDAGRPFLMEGTPRSGSGSQITDTHAFVCDGYAEEGYFHLNFGWSGSGDGWYLLDNVNPLASDFSANQHAYIGIRPSLVAVEAGQAFINVTPEGVGVVVGGYGDVVAPETVAKDGKSYPVMKVDAHAFDVPTSKFDTHFEQYLKEYLTRITLPGSVTEIGEFAFQSPYLTEVNLPASIRRIGANAFYYSRNINKVSIPSLEAWFSIDFEPYPLRPDFDQYMSNPIWNTDNKYEGRLYIAGEEATDIYIPASIKEVKPAVFTGYQFLNSLSMESGVEKIGAYAFERVPLKQIYIAPSVKELGTRAFYQHEASTIKIPAGLTKVGSEALMGNKVAEYIVDENNPKYSAYQGILYDKSRRTLVHCPNYRPGFYNDNARDVVGVPSSVTTIRAHSFGSTLRKLTLPPSVRNIENEAFANTYSLRDLYVYTQQPLPVTASMFHMNATSMYNKVNVHVPMGAGDAYRAAPVWQDMNIVEDHPEGSLPPKNYEFTSDYNAIQITDYMPADGVSFTPQYYLFDSHPVITFTGTSMLITSATSRYLFEKDHYQEMYFTHYDDPNGLDDVKTNGNQVVIRTIGQQLVISGLEDHTQVTLYGIEGRQLASTKASANGETRIDIPATDLILVKAGSYSFKIHTKR